MKSIHIFLKGILIGFVSVAIPGLSASTIAIILGIYYLMIQSISELFKNFKKSISFLLILIAGYAGGAFIGANLVSVLYDYFPLVMVFVTLGFIIGSFPKMILEIKPYLNKLSNWLVVFIIWLALLLFSFLVIQKEEVVLTFDMPIRDYIWLAGIGIVTAGTLVIPGMDFAVVLLSFGYYHAIMGLMNVFSGDILSNLFILGVYLIGYGIGAFLLSKLIQQLAKKYESKMKFANFAFVAISPFLVVKQGILNNSYFNQHHIISDQTFGIAIILGIIAFLSVIIINHFHNPNDNRVRGMKKRNLLRFFYAVVSRAPLALYYMLKMRKIGKEDQLPFEKRYELVIKIAKEINKSGHIHLQVFGKEYLNNETSLYIVNHQGRYDGIGVFLALEDHPSTLIADRGRIIHPFYSDMFTMLKGAAIDRGNLRELVQIMNDVGERLKNGRSFIGFIEGRWGDNQNHLQEFHTGILRPAYASHVQIVPIVLYDTWKVFSVSSIKKIYPEAHILPAISYEEYKELTKQELATLIKQKMQSKLDEIEEQKDAERK